MAIDAVKIPQNVYVEERILGPITLRQIIITMIGGAISWVIWSGIKSAGGVTIVSGILSWTPAVIAAAFAFVKINDISLFRLLLLLIERMEKPATRVWGPRQGLMISIRVSTDKRKRKKGEEVKKERKTKERIEELSELLDTEIESVPAQSTDEDVGSYIEQAFKKASAAEEDSSAALGTVDPNRISAEPLNESIDSVGPSKQSPDEQLPDDPLFRDINPPS